jgi:hypothetical protein
VGSSGLKGRDLDESQVAWNPVGHFKEFTCYHMNKKVLEKSEPVSGQRSNQNELERYYSYLNVMLFSYSIQSTLQNSTAFQDWWFMGCIKS